MNVRYFLHFSVLGLGLSSAACLQVDAEIPAACFLETDVNMTAVVPIDPEMRERVEQARENGLALPAQFAPQLDAETTFSREGLEAIPEALDGVGVDSRIALSFVEVFATKGLDSFEGIQAIRLVMAPARATSELEPVDLARCVVTEGCDTSGQTVLLAGGEGLDLVPYLREGNLDFTLSVEGAAPLDLWTFDVDVCMSGFGRYERSVF